MGVMRSCCFLFFFFKQKTAYEMRISDWSSDVCSSDLPDGLDMVYVSRFPAHKEMFVNMPLGMRIPMFCTASGRAILSRLEPDVALDVLRKNKRVSYTANTITSMNQLEEILDEARTSGERKNVVKGKSVSDSGDNGG